MLLEFPSKFCGEPRLSDGAGFGLTIAPRVVPARHSWQHFEASTAVRIASACSVRTGVRDEPLSLPNHMGQPIFAAARDARAHGSGSRDAATSRPTAGDAHAQETRAGPDSTEGAGPAGKLAFPSRDEPASRSNERPVLK